jgi:phosphatidate cytidylyltransferase
MKVRIISGVVAVALLVLVLFLRNTIVFPLCIAAISAMAIYELFRAKDCLRYRISLYAALLYTVSSPILLSFQLNKAEQVVLIAMVMIVFLDGVVQHQRLKMDQVSFMLIAMVFVTKSLGLLQTLLQSDERFGLVYVILALSSAWVADTGAYFTGTFLGKHKLCPQISPKKTVEGFIGGIAGTIVVFFVFSLIYGSVAQIHVHYGWVMFIAAACAVISVLGDLTASILKRQCSMKDFGNIMPGHGGVMDRFDSALFTVPVFYVLNTLLPIYYVQ